jgi:hypothetical protein
LLGRPAADEEKDEGKQQPLLRRGGRKQRAAEKILNWGFIVYRFLL